MTLREYLSTISHCPKVSSPDMERELRGNDKAKVDGFLTGLDERSSIWFTLGKTMTNAEWIRSMSDKDLGEFLLGLGQGCMDWFCPAAFICNASDDAKEKLSCEEKMDRWLKAPMDEQEAKT